jgi:hypothetical protein
MQRTYPDLAVGTLGLRIVRRLQACHCATTSSLISHLGATPDRLRSELAHLETLGLVLHEDQQWRASVDGLLRWRRELEGRLLGAA